MGAIVGVGEYKNVNHLFISSDVNMLHGELLKVGLIGQ